MDGQNCPASNRCEVNYGVYFSGAHHHVPDPKPAFAFALKAFTTTVVDSDGKLVFGGFCGRNNQGFTICTHNRIVKCLLDYARYFKNSR